MRSYILHCKFATDQYVLLSWYNRHLVNYDEVVPWFETMFKTVQIKFMECLLLKVTPSILVHTFNRAFIGMFYCSLSFLSKHNIGYDNLLLFVNSHCFLGPKWKQKKTNYCNVFFFMWYGLFSVDQMQQCETNVNDRISSFLARCKSHEVCICITFQKRMVFGCVETYWKLGCIFIFP